MLDVLLAALAELLSPVHLAYMMVGISVGLVIGILPALGGVAGMSLLIPFIYGMDEVSALAMLIGLVAILPTSDTFSSILLGIPGGSSSQATVLDGFPLARRGEAARALSAAFISSLFGGLFGAIALTGFVLVARPLILAFGSAELFMLALLGLSMVAVLAGRSLPKGLTACGLGLLLGSIGGAPATGEFRMTLDIFYLYDGVPLTLIGLGVFALPEIVDLLRTNAPIAGDAPLGRGWSQGLRDWGRNWFLSLRTSVIGCVVGVIPGLGGSVVDWIAYGHAVQTTKDNPQFGKGDIRGVIAPESANNSMQGGAMMPTILFGIPGSGSMAVFLGGMVLIGIEPGPSMVGADLNLTYTMIWSLALANVFGAGICAALSRPIAELTRIPFQLVAPFMIVLICFAAFQATRSTADLVALLALGAVGVLLKRFGWPRPALLIGYVLAPQAETYLYQAVQFHGWSFLYKPGVLIIAAIIAVSVWYGLRNRVDESMGVTGGTVAAARGSRAAQAAFAVAALAILLFGVWDAAGRSFLGSIFPLLACATTAVFAAILVWRIVKAPDSDPALFDAESAEDARGSAWSGLFWIAALVALSVLTGFLIAAGAFLAIFLRLRAGQSLGRTAAMTATALSGLTLMAYALSLNFPSGLLQEIMDLPWPLR